jgi:protein gp37
MSEHTKIEWADHTFNPWVGCAKVSSACDHCYAESWAKRSGHPELWNGERRRTTGTNWQLPIKWNRRAAASGKRPKVFCASLADVFDNQAPRRWRDDLWHWIDQTPHLDWLLLTKRPQNIAKMLPDPETGVKPWGGGWPNVWLGVSAGNQEEADRNIPILGATPARVHFVSLEPLLGPIDLTAIACPNGCQPPDYCTRCDPDGGEPTGTYDVLGAGWIDLVIVGGESGPNARPMYPSWPRDVRDQCQGAGVPFFFKRHGEWIGVSDLRRLPGGGGPGFGIFDHCPYDQHHEAVRIGTRAAGRELDGRTWDEMPEPGQRPQRQAGSDPLADRLCDDATMMATP